MAVSGHWKLRLVSNVYQVCFLFYIGILSYLGNIFRSVRFVVNNGNVSLNISGESAIRL
jgi:hypothetical protein